MSALKIKKFSDVDKRTEENYIASYECYQGEALLYRLDYKAKMNMCQPCAIVDSKAQSILEIRPAQGIGREKISFFKESQFLLKKVGNALVNGEGKNVALVVDPTSFGKAIVRNALNGNPDNYVLCTPDKKHTLARIHTIPTPKRLPWPLSIPESILRALFRPLDRYLYQIDQVEQSLTPELLFALSVLLMQQNNNPA